MGTKEQRDEDRGRGREKTYKERRLVGEGGEELARKEQKMCVLVWGGGNGRSLLVCVG